MKRLTERDEDGFVWTGIDTNCVNGSYDILDKKWLDDALDRLAAIEDILGDEYDLDRLREMVEAEKEDRYIIMKEPRRAGVHRLTELAEADREGRCVVLPCKKGDTVWRIVNDATPQITKDRCTNIKVENKEVWVNLIGDRVMGGWNFGKLLFLNEKEAEAALKARGQNEH